LARRYPLQSLSAVRPPRWSLGCATAMKTTSTSGAPAAVTPEHEAEAAAAILEG